MSEVIRRADGFVVVEERRAPGMIAVRADLSDKAVVAALGKVLGGLPAPRRLLRREERRILWFGPDELLVLLDGADRDAVTTLCRDLEAALGETHALVADMSDARAFFQLTGAGAAEVLAKLSPVDLATFAEDEVRRTRLSRIAGAFWREGEGFAVVVLRSYADHAFRLLADAAAAGGEVGVFPR